MVRFKIIDTFKLTNIGVVVMAECLEDDYVFSLSDSALLGEVKIKPIINMPPKIDKDGNIKLNVFVFQLKVDSDRDKFQIGEIVDLKP